MKKVLCFSVILFFIFLGSCKKATDPDFCSGAWVLQIQDEINAVTSAAIVYSGDPTLANCNAYKAAYQAYIDALEPFVQCTTWTAAAKADWQAALDEAEAEIDTLCD